MLNIVVWHPGYTCKVYFSCRQCDLRSVDALRHRLVLALFDHGVCAATLERMKRDDMFHVDGSRLVPVVHPMRLPQDATLSMDHVIFDTDPDAYRVRVSPNLVLPVSVGAGPIRTVYDIERRIRQRLRGYGIYCGQESSFHVHRARWTVCRPTRRSFKEEVISVFPAPLCQERVYFEATMRLQSAWRRRHQRACARRIQRALRAHLQRRSPGGDWTVITVG